VRVLTRQGFELQGFENVLGIALPVPAPGPASPVEVSRATDAGLWRATLIDGFGAPDLGVQSAPPEEFPRDALEAVFDDMSSGPGFTMYTARLDGEPVGAAGMRLIADVAQLCGAATLPGWRRRGVQTALLRQRLADAAAAGCDLSVVTTQPGSRSEQNAHGAGFSLLYTRAVLVWPPPGRPAMAGST
jgi:GNAT superfamily N-acetyltransferase